MKKYLLLWISILGFNIGYSQIAYFEKVFGDSTIINKGIAVIEAADGMLYYVGYENSGAQNNNQISLYKIAPDGTEIWYSTHTSTSNDYVNSMILHNNILLIAGETHDSTGNIDAFVMQFDTSGNYLKTIADGSPSSTKVYASISPTSDTGWVCSGFITGSGSGNDFYVVKYAADGSIDWAKNYGSTGNETAYKALQLPNGTYAVVGDEEQNGGNYNVLLKGLDTQGNETWSETVRETQNGGSKNMILTHDNHLMVIGEMNPFGQTNFDMYLVKATTNGTVIWTKFLNGTTGGDAGFSLLEVNPNSYVITGYSKNPTTQDQDVLLLSIDSVGNKIAEQYYGSSGPEIGYTIIASQNGGFLIAGFTNQNGKGQHYLIYDDIQLAVAVYDKQEKEIALFPNPIQAHQIHFNRPLVNHALRIFNSHGQLIEQTILSGDSYQIKKSLATGIYFVQIQQQQIQKTFKIIIP